MTQEEYDEATKNTFPQREVAIVQTVNGYSIAGNTHFIDADSKVERSALQHNAVAIALGDVLTLTERYLATGDFLGTITAPKAKASKSVN